MWHALANARPAHGQIVLTWAGRIADGRMGIDRWDADLLHFDGAFEAGDVPPTHWAVLPLPPADPPVMPPMLRPVALRAS